MKKALTIWMLFLVALACVSAQGGRNLEQHCPPASDHREVALYLEVPEFIETGLTDDSMERVGGVIRYRDNKQAIAWLRQGGQMGQVAESAAGLLERITSLSGSEHLALGRLLASVTPILNISMAGFSLVEHIAGIRAHAAELERIFDRVSEEFQRDREVELLAALSFAENAFTAGSEAYKHEAVAQVSYELTVARAQLMRDLDELLVAEISKDNENAELAMTYQVLAMKVCAMSARLRLEIGEDEAALNGLSQCVAEHEDYTGKFVRKWVGEPPAFYFHESVSDAYFERYIDIERWLQDERDVLAEIVKNNRQHFWDQASLYPLDASTVGFQIDENPFYLEAIPNAEILIENMQRFQGFEQELKSMCLPNFAEWEAFESEKISEQIDYVLLVDSAHLPSG